MQAYKVKRSGENALSRGASPSGYGSEVTKVKLPRKARTTIIYKYLYPKPTQVGR